MKNYKENDMVIYTDAQGNRFDTFLIFDTDRSTGLTQINHSNLIVSLDELELHPRSENGCAIPMDDTYSFELFRKLKEKFTHMDEAKQNPALKVYRDDRNPVDFSAFTARSSPSMPAVLPVATLVVTATSSIKAAMSSKIAKKPAAIFVY